MNSKFIFIKQEVYPASHFYNNIIAFRAISLHFLFNWWKHSSFVPEGFRYVHLSSTVGRLWQSTAQH